MKHTLFFLLLFASAFVMTFCLTTCAQGKTMPSGKFISYHFTRGGGMNPFDVTVYHLRYDEETGKKLLTISGDCEGEEITVEVGDEVFVHCLELVKKNVAFADNSDNEVEVHRYKSDKGVMMTVSQGEQITVEEDMEDETDGWIEVSTEQGKGYVKSEDVSVTDAYPVAETAEEQHERIENATVKDIADDAQMKADKASEVAQAAAEKAEEAASIVEDEETEHTKADERRRRQPWL